ncbi:MAG: exodeoxyribonuclease VII small subunit [Oscillospiraceae bacterium]|jgi:exodeoxyribonuclease VII small subunit|nr:exodeoxyribonuclease VII small subunit [Oscillospiraceae bacterium]
MKKMTFENSMKKLEEIVASLEKGELSVEDAIKFYEEGMKLASSCYNILEKAQQKVTKLKNSTNVND